MKQSTLRPVTLAALAFVAAQGAALAQQPVTQPATTGTPSNYGAPASQPAYPAGTPTAAPGATLSGTPTSATTQQAGAGQTVSQPAAAQPTVSPVSTTPVYAPPPLPAVPTAGGPPVMFGSQMFTGRFSAVTFNGFNPDYTLTTGDRVVLRLWGAVVYEAVQLVDAQGNVFIPNVGPIKVAGVRNGALNEVVDAAVRRVFRANVGVYATLDAAQPVMIYVTGFVRAPGMYGGLSSDSVLYYLDKAGGVDPERGSYLSVDVMRNGKVRERINLYDFMLKGTIDSVQLQSGDTILVAPRRNSVLVSGEAFNPYRFEIDKVQVSGSDVLAMAVPTPNATHMAVIRANGLEQRSEYYPLDQAANVAIEAGDQVVLTSDKHPGTIQVRVDGAQMGPRSLIMPYGAQLKDVMARLNPAPQANMAGMQLFRRSIAVKQKESLDSTLRGLEVAALTGRSSTAEEAGLRRTEADLIMQFVERARLIVPKGQVVLADTESAGNTLMEDGDVINIPVMSNTVAVSGEVTFPNTIVYAPNASVDQYIDWVGGTTQRADRSNVMVLKPNGVVLASNDTPTPGDEIIVFPKVESKFIEIARGVTSVLYQLAVSAGVLTNINNN